MIPKWALGAIINISGSIAINLGTNLMKLSHKLENGELSLGDFEGGDTRPGGPVSPSNGRQNLSDSKHSNESSHAKEGKSLLHPRSASHPLGLLMGKRRELELSKYESVAADGERCMSEDSRCQHSGNSSAGIRDTVAEAVGRRQNGERRGEALIEGDAESAELGGNEVNGGRRREEVVDLLLPRSDDERNGRLDLVGEGSVGVDRCSSRHLDGCFRHSSPTRDGIGQRDHRQTLDRHTFHHENGEPGLDYSIPDCVLRKTAGFAGGKGAALTPAEIMLEEGIPLSIDGETRSEDSEVDGQAPQRLESRWRIKALWYSGAILLVLGSLVNFASFGFAPQSLLASLGSVQFVSNVFFGKLILREIVTMRIVAGTATIIIGNTLSLCFSPHQDANYNSEELKAFYDADYNSLLACELLFALAMNMTYKRFKARKESGYPIRYGDLIMPLAYAICSAIIGTQSVVQAKCLSELVTMTFRGENQMGSLFTYIVIIAWTATTIFWLTRMNKALAMFHGLFIIPALQVFWTFFSVIGGGFYFEEFSTLTIASSIGFSIGILVVFSGVYLLAPRTQLEHPSRRSPGASGGGLMREGEADLRYMLKMEGESPTLSPSATPTESPLRLARDRSLEAGDEEIDWNHTRMLSVGFFPSITTDQDVGYLTNPFEDIEPEEVIQRLNPWRARMLSNTGLDSISPVVSASDRSQHPRPKNTPPANPSSPSTGFSESQRGVTKPSSGDIGRGVLPRTREAEGRRGSFQSSLVRVAGRLVHRPVRMPSWHGEMHV